MANLQKILKLTQEQYNTLASGGTVGQYTGLNDNFVYFIVDTNNYVVADENGNVNINGDLKGNTIYESGTSLANKYLGKTATAADSDKLDGQDSTYYLNYNNLTNKPTIPAAQVQTDWNATSGMGVLLNKPTLATVATSGSYNDLSNKPTIPTSIDGMSGGSLTSPLTMYGGDSATASKLILDASRSGQVTDQSNATLFGFLSNNATTFTVGGNSYSLNLRGNAVRPKYKGSDLALYSDIPTVPTKTSDLNNDSGFITKAVNDLTNYTLTSSLATVATSGSYNDLTSKPTIPTQASDVNDYGQKYVNPTQVRDYQTIFGIAPTLLTNINGHSLSSIYNTEDVTIDGYPAVKIRNNDGNTNLTFDQSHNYMRKITGSNFTPIFDDGTVPQYSYIVGGDGTIYKPQWDSTNGLLLYKVNRLAMYSNIPSTYLKSASASGNTLTLTKQDNSTVTFTPSFSESDTLATVTGRGATTTNTITVNDSSYNAIIGPSQIKVGYLSDYPNYVAINYNGTITNKNQGGTYTLTLPSVTGTLSCVSANPSSTSATLTGLTINGTSYAIESESVSIVDLRS